jgi:hypothetical protein
MTDVTMGLMALTRGRGSRGRQEAAEPRQLVCRIPAEINEWLLKKVEEEQAEHPGRVVTISDVVRETLARAMRADEA